MGPGARTLHEFAFQKGSHHSATVAVIPHHDASSSPLAPMSNLVRDIE